MRKEFLFLFVFITLFQNLQSRNLIQKKDETFQLLFTEMEQFIDEVRTLKGDFNDFKNLAYEVNNLIRKNFKHLIIPDQLIFAKKVANIYLRYPNSRKMLRIEISKDISFFSKNLFCEWVMELLGYDIDLCY
jgi:hypothetical protein